MGNISVTFEAENLAKEIENHIVEKLLFTHIKDAKENAKKIIHEYLSKLDLSGDTLPLCRVLSNEEHIDYHLLQSKKVGEYDLSIMTYREKIAFAYLFDVPVEDIILEFKPPKSTEYSQLRVQIK